MAHAKESEGAAAAITGAQTGVLLFYNIETGLATTGRIDTGGNYADLKNHNFDRGWSGVFPLGNGLVLFNKRPPESSLLVGRVQPDGSYHDLREFPRFGNPVRMVPVGGDIVLEYRSNNDVILWRVNQADGSLFRLRGHSGFDNWLFAVSTHDGLVLFYRQNTGTAATIRVHNDGTFQDLKSFSGFEIWTHIVSTTDRILLFYNEGTGAAATGRLGPEGDFVDLATFSLDRNWRYVVPTIDGHVLFFSNLKQQGAALGRIDANGVFADGPALNTQFDPWTYIVSVI